MKKVENLCTYLGSMGKRSCRWRHDDHLQWKWTSHIPWIQCFFERGSLRSKGEGTLPPARNCIPVSCRQVARWAHDEELTALAASTSKIMVVAPPGREYSVWNPKILAEWWTYLLWCNDRVPIVGCSAGVCLRLFFFGEEEGCGAVVSEERSCRPPLATSHVPVAVHLDRTCRHVEFCSQTQHCTLTVNISRPEKLSIHFSGDDETVEVIFSHDHLRQSAVADMCEELTSRDLWLFCKYERHLLRRRSQKTMVAQTDFSTTTNPLRTCDQVRRKNLLRKYKKKSQLFQISDLSSCAPMQVPRSLSFEGIFLTVDEAEPAKLDCPNSCWEYTLPLDDEVSKAKGWIRGDTKICPVSEGHSQFSPHLAMGLALGWSYTTSRRRWSSRIHNLGIDVSLKIHVFSALVNSDTAELLAKRRRTWEEIPPTARIRTLLTRSETFEQFKDILEEDTSILHCKTQCCYWANFAEYIYHTKTYILSSNQAWSRVTELYFNQTCIMDARIPQALKREQPSMKSTRKLVAVKQTSRSKDCSIQLSISRSTPTRQ